MISIEEGAKAGFGNYPVTVIPHYTVQMSDGVQLAIKVWFPAGDTSQTCFKDCKGILQYSPETPSKFEPQPVILEYLPYRKSDWTLARDHQRHLWWSSHGYVCVRVDMRGSGDSEGLYYDEYAPQEQKDGVEVINWLAQQPWCNGRVGMYGKSWGGFNGLYMAYEQPEALKVREIAFLALLFHLARTPRLKRHH